MSLICSLTLGSLGHEPLITDQTYSLTSWARRFLDCLKSFRAFVGKYGKLSLRNCFQQIVIILSWYGMIWYSKQNQPSPFTIFHTLQGKNNTWRHVSNWGIPHLLFEQATMPATYTAWHSEARLLRFSSLSLWARLAEISWNKKNVLGYSQKTCYVGWLVLVCTGGGGGGFAYTARKTCRGAAT